MRYEYPGVRGNFFAFLEDEYVAFDHFLVGYDDLLVFSDDGRVGFNEILECAKRVLRASLLDGADYRVKNEDREDEGAVNELPHHEYHGARAEEHVNEGAFELPQKNSGVAVRFRFGQDVRTQGSVSLCRFSIRKAFFSGRERTQDRSYRFGMPHVYHIGAAAMLSCIALLYPIFS